MVTPANKIFVVAALLACLAIARCAAWRENSLLDIITQRREPEYYDDDDSSDNVIPIIPDYGPWRYWKPIRKIDEVINRPSVAYGGGGMNILFPPGPRVPAKDSK
ncbi:PREDICTED: uncharacterized protein LOC106812852 [Priapulus caudatus]|uniref:Uncharacterized protein LOC106812852 n=1 Tax=Priapulus caudatus TaxID=37621 RepID=A0ABM1EJF0_PRICU|nr:PREDICTED: uncharacterized protein LOC106812852 [Priapulus caudatus]